MDKSLFSNLWHKVFRSGNPLFLFIGLNTLVFLLLNLLGVLVAFRLIPSGVSVFVASLFQMPANLPALLVRPWTVATYMFTQIGFFHFLFNMLWLFWMGRIFMDFLSARQFVFTYLAGGLAGALLFLLAYQVIPVFAEQQFFTVLMGSSAAVSAVVFATATLLPEYSIRMLFFGNVKLKYLALAFIVLDLLRVGGGNAGGSIAHIGGALFGFVFIRQLQRGTDWSRIFDRRIRFRRSRLRVASRNADSRRGETRRENDSWMPSQEAIDRILDKISQSGYDSLSKAEKEALFRVGKQEDQTNS